MIKVSIIVPIYNVEKYLAICLESIIKQSYTNLEIVCINDGSTDNSLKIVEKFLLKDKRIILINQENSGLGAARNIGVKKSTGQYLLFVDSDDFLDLEAIEQLVTMAQKENPDFIQFGFRNYPKSGSQVKQNNDKGEGLSLFEKYKKIPVSTWSKFWKKSFFVNNNLYNIEKYYYEDVPTYLKAYYYGKNVVLSDLILYNYRVNENSITQMKLTPKHLESRLVIVQIIFDFLIKEKLFAKKRYVYVFFRQMLSCFHVADKKGIEVLESIRKKIPNICFITAPLKYKVLLFFSVQKWHYFIKK